jgi:uncharacterized protein
MELSNKIIVITGASKGLGKEIALRLCLQNPYLVLIARSENLLQETEREVESLIGRRPLIIPCDISNETDVNRMLGIIQSNFHHIDVLINNAGIGIHKISEKMSNEEMRKQFEVNFYGPFYVIKALLPFLKSSDSAYILNIGSLAGEISFADNGVYASTKSALMGFSKSLHLEMKEFNIKVGLFLPGLMNTSFQHDREKEIRVPAFLNLNPQKAAVKIEEMIYKRRKQLYMYRWMLLLMKIKQLTG